MYMVLHGNVSFKICFYITIILGRRYSLIHVNDLQDKLEGLDVSVLPTGSVAGSPVAPHPYG